MNKLLLVKTASRARRCVIHAANTKIQCKHPAYAVHFYSVSFGQVVADAGDILWPSSRLDSSGVVVVAERRRTFGDLQVVIPATQLKQYIPYSQLVFPRTELQNFHLHNS